MAGMTDKARIAKYKKLVDDYKNLIEKFIIHKKESRVEIESLKLKYSRMRKRTTDKPLNPSQNDLIRFELEGMLGIGVTDKDLLFTTVEKRLNIARPTVRRVAREMRLFYEESVKILSVDIDRGGKKQKTERFLNDL